MPRKSLHSSINNLSYKSLLIILFFLLIGVVVLWKFVLPNHKISAAWWNDGWNYRKAVSISNTSGSNLTDFQVSLSIGTSALIASGKMQSDCDDIRVTDINGNLLPHWIHPDFPCNTDTTKIFVKIPSIPTSDATIFLYYGNSIAANSQNPLDVFYLWDDFNGATLDNSKWSTTGTSTHGSITTINGYASLNNTANENTVINSQNSYLQDDYIIESRLKISGSTTDLDGQAGWNGEARDNIGPADNANEKPHGIVAPAAVQGTEFITTSWKPFTFQAKSGNIKSTFGVETLISSATHSYGTGNIFFLSNVANISTHIDFIALRKYASVEPTSTLQSEEAGGGPIAYWKFDEGTGTTAYDSSTNQNNGVISGATWTTDDQCISGKCLYFNGSNSGINLNSLSSIKFPYTISFWMKPQKLSTSQSIISLKGADTFPYFAMTGGNKLLAYGGGEKYRYGSKTFTSSDLNQWFFVTFTVTDSASLSNWKVYLNGKDDTGSPGANTNTYYDPSSSGSIGKNGSGEYFQGYLDEIKIYPYARTADQIKKDYNSRGSSKGTSANLGSAASDSNLSDGLVGYWKMDENTGTSTADSSGNSNTGTLTNVGWTNGKYGIGTSYNGTNNVILVPDTNNSLDMPNDFTISFWVNPDSGGTKELVAKSSGENYEIWQSSTNLSVRVNGVSPVVSAGSIFTYGQWTHITVKYERSTGLVTIYQNGNYFTNGANTNAASINNSSLQIGAYSDGTSYPFSGKIDELRIYNRALSPSEITQLYNYAPGPIAYWDLNEASGTTVNDKSGNNLTGTFGIGTSAPSWSSGKYGGGVDFSSTTKFINIPVNSSFQTNTSGRSFSYSLWFKSKNVSVSNQYLITDNEPCNNPGTFAIYLSGGNIGFNYYSLSAGSQVSQIFTPSTALQNNTWYHLEWTKTFGQLGVQAYLNGIPQTISGDSNNTGNTTSRILLGAWNGTGSTCTGGVTDSPPVANWSLNGSIDEVKIYNYIRTQKQIIEDMTAGAPAVSSKSMISYWKFDEGSGTTANNSGNGGSTLNGTFGTGNSAPTWTNDGKFNKALNFNSAQFVRIPTNSGLNYTQDGFTYSAWIKPTTLNSGYNMFIGQYLPYFDVYTNRLHMSMTAAGSQREVYGNTQTITTGQWYYVTATYDSQGYMKIYLNGKLDGTAGPYLIPANSGNDLYIGKWASDGSYPFNGLIDEVKIYNYALTADEVKQDYNQGSAIQMGQTSQTISGTTTSLEYCIPGDTSPCASPVAEWNFEENTGLNTKDISGNNNTGTISGATWTTGANNKGAALNFNGSSDYVSIPDSSTSLSGNFTVSFWVNPNDDGNNPRWFSLIDGSNNLQIGHMGSNEKVYFRFADSVIETTTGITLNRWTYITCKMESGTRKIFLNGIEQTTESDGITTNATYSAIGGGFTNYTASGKIDNVKIYNYARTPAQVAYDYNKGGPIGWWKLDECQGSVANDSSGIGNTGSINISASGTQTSVGTCTTSGTAWGNGASGHINSSLNFDGTDDYVSIPNLLTDYPVSVSMWIKPNIVTDADIAFYLYLASGKYITGGFYTSYGFITNTNNVHADASLFPVGQWKHVVVTMTSPSTGKIYVDGLDKTTSSAQRYTESGTISNIGARNNSNLFSGQIDDVRIYNYALTTEQVKTLYNGGAVSFN